MANLIQIKRSLNTAVPTSLANGELAYTANGDVLFIGSNGNVEAIGGKRNPGVLTANQALVANSTGYIDQVKTSNLVVGAITANGGTGSSGQALFSNGSAVYWDSAGAGSVTSVGTGNGLTGGPITSSGTISVNANDGIVANSTGLFVNQGTGLVVNATGVHVNSSYIGTLAANSATYLGGNTASDLRSYSDTVAGTAYSNAMSDTLSRNGTYTGNNIFQGTRTTFDNNVVLGSDGSDNIALNGSVNTAIVPSANVTYDLGTPGKRWKDLYLSGSSLYLGTTTLSDTSGALSTANIVATTGLKTQDLVVEGNTALGSATSDVVSFVGYVNTAITPSTNATYSLGTSTTRWATVHAANIAAVDGNFSGSVEIAGNLIVSGNVTTTNVNSVVISDPLIYLAGNNYASDSVDIGFVGNYNTGSANAHTGLFRHAAVDQYYLFKGLTQELDNVLTVNTADPTFTIADLNAYLISGGLRSNATHVAITANSSVNVSIVANTLSLTTALATTSGGTGTNSYTSGDILVANSGNALSKLALGTAGYVLQSNGSALIYDTLDGGTF